MRQSSGGAWIADDTEALRADIALTLTETFTITRKGLGSGDAAGPSSTWEAVEELTEIPGAISLAREEAPKEEEDQARVVTETKYDVHLLAGAWESIRLTDRVVHVDTGIEYELTTIVEPTTENAATLLKVSKVNE